MSPGERHGRAVATRGFLDEDGIAVDEDSAGPDEELLPALRRSEHRVPPRRPDGADDPAVRLDRPETQHLGHERPDLAGREIRHRDHVSAQQLRLAVPRLYSGRRPPDPKRTEVDL